MYGRHEPYFTDLYTQSRTFLFLASLSLPIVAAGTPTLFNCSTWYFIRPRKLDKQAIMIVKTAPVFHLSETLLMERAERLKSFKTWREGLQSHLPLTIFLCNPPVLREGTSLHLGTPRHSLKLRYLTAAISHISSASAMLEC